MVRFDAYSATSEAAKRDDLLQVLMDAGGIGSMLDLRQGRGFHTFGERLSVRDECGEWASVMWGGKQGDRVMLEVKGERTPAAVAALRERFEHRCTRVDSCVDFDSPRAFERLYRSCRQVKKAHGIWGDKRGDWEDHPEKGRTFYLGANSSATRLRLYEKGKQPEYEHLSRPDWVRIEVQVRPQKHAREAFSRLSAAEVWGSSKWSRSLAAVVLKEHVDPHPAGTVYRLSERERALRWMVKQYGHHLAAEAADLGGWDCLGETLHEMHKEISGD